MPLYSIPPPQFSRQFDADIRRWEGESLVAYKDSRGFWTQGIGRHVGIDADSPPIDETDAANWLREDAITAWRGARELFPGLDTFDVVRREALVALVFNMGEETLSQFVPFLEHVNLCEWDEAAYHLLVNMKGHITPYTLQVGARAEETALRIATGNVLKEFLVP